MHQENRRSFVKKSLATSVSISFAGLIRAHGEESGGTTTWNPDGTTIVTTDSGGTTTWNPDVSTTPPTTETTTTTTVSYHLHLIQNNWPIRNSANTDTVDTAIGQLRTTQDIFPGNGIAYINGEPEIPDLLARIEDDAGVPRPSSDAVSWYLTIVTDHPDRGAIDNRRIPVTSVITLPANEYFNIGDAFGGEFVGGTVTLYYTSSVLSGSSVFKIHGANPLDAKARYYITSRLNYGIRFPWAYAVVQHESRQTTNNTVYNQFNSAGSLMSLPNFSANGSDDGWGMAQLDTPLGTQASTQEVYNWQSNIETFFQELVEKENLTNLYLSAVQATWPGQWEALPDYTPPGTTTALSGIDASIMKLYNGGESTKHIVNGLISDTGTNDQLVPIAWSFDHTKPPGNRWEILDVSGYIQKVIDREIETPLTYSD